MPWNTAAVAIVVTGATLSAAGAALTAWALLAGRSRGRRRCPKCWYSMAGVPGTRCPECGKDARRERRLFKTRRRRKWAALGIFLLLLGTLGILGRNTPQRRLIAMTPDWVWRYVLPRLDVFAEAVYTRLTQNPSSRKAASPVEQLLLARYVIMQVEQGADASHAAATWDWCRSTTPLVGTLAGPSIIGSGGTRFGEAYVMKEADRLLAHSTNPDVRGEALLLRFGYPDPLSGLYVSVLGQSDSADPPELADLLNRQLLGGCSRRVEQACANRALQMPAFREQLRPGLIAALRYGASGNDYPISRLFRPDLDVATILLEGPEKERVLLACDHILALGPKASALTSRLLDHVDQADYYIRMTALDALIAIAPAPSERMISSLLNAVTSDDSPVRVRAADALAAIAPTDPRTVAALTTALSDPRPVLRASAAYHLGEIGAPALSAVPTLESLRADPDSQVAEEATKALKRMKR
jgi:hypothetical protein